MMFREARTVDEAVHGRPVQLLPDPLPAPPPAPHEDLVAGISIANALVPHVVEWRLEGKPR